MTSPIYESAKDLSERFGIDVSIEVHAQAFDAVFPGLGDVLRTLWHDIRGDLIRTPAHLSGAANELDYYAAPAVVAADDDDFCTCSCDGCECSGHCAVVYTGCRINQPQEDT